MKIIYNYVKRDASKSLEDLITKKFFKLKKFFRGKTLAEVTLKGNGKEHVMHVSIDTSGYKINANSASHDMYKNIDLCIDKIKIQAKKAKKEYRTDSKKINAKVAFSDEHNLEPESMEETEGESA
ncbi:MAG: ribosome-associated translation inhibitor RaiA [Clostridia bacterium]|nr:ribosome-associated translation inhibitor RaiA [Clostridia bacterium]